MFLRMRATLADIPDIFYVCDHKLCKTMFSLRNSFFFIYVSIDWNYALCPSAGGLCTRTSRDFINRGGYELKLGSRCIQYLFAAFTSWDVNAVNAAKVQHCLELRLIQPVCGLYAAMYSSGALTLGRNMHVVPGSYDCCGHCAFVFSTGFLELGGFLEVIVETITQIVEREQRETESTCSKAGQSVAPEVITVPYLCSIRTGYLIKWTFYVFSCCGCSIADCSLYFLESSGNRVITSLRYQQNLTTGATESSWGFGGPAT